MLAASVLKLKEGWRAAAEGDSGEEIAAHPTHAARHLICMD